MEQPYLIQRGYFKQVTGPITGIDQLIRFDYMGSAEFEFGALPNSLKQMTRDYDEYQIFETEYAQQTENGKIPIKVICKLWDKDRVIKFIIGIFKDSYRLKECSYFKESIIHQKGKLYPRNFNFWWDIVNNYMFCAGDDKARDILTALKAVRDKKAAEKATGWYK